MLFSAPGKYKPCGIFTIGHLSLFVITVFGIIISLKRTVNKTKDEIKIIIKKCTNLIWIMEIGIIIFKVVTGGFRNVNNYVPLYFCSLLLYSGLLASYGKGKLKRVGEVFLATGGIVGGIIFMILPTTSLPSFPAFHIVSIHSFIYHGIMVYLGFLVNITNYVTIYANDIKYYAFLVGIICILAYIVNKIFDSNLMFISKDFPGTPLTILYKATGKFFTLVTSIGQMTIPFYMIYGFSKIKKLKK